MGIQINGTNDTITTNDGSIVVNASTDITGSLTGTTGTFSGDVGVAGTLTSEDKTNIDSVGLITARTGIKVGPITGVAATHYADGSIRTTGIITATKFVGDIEGGTTGSTGTFTRVVVGSSSTITSGGIDLGSAGIVTAMKYYGDGSSLTGIDASTLKQGNNVKAAANHSGIIVTGVCTATKFQGDGSLLTNLPLNTIEQNIAQLGFYRASDHSKVKYNLVDQVIDTYQDTSGIDAGASTSEMHTSGYYYGGSSAVTDFVITEGGSAAGTKTSTGGYTYYEMTHTYGGNGLNGGSGESTSTYSVVVPSSGTIEVLLVGGGGSGRSTHGGWNGSGNGPAGNGGARYHNSSLSVTAQTYTIVVGGGGHGWTSTNPGLPSTGFGQSAAGGTNATNTYYQGGNGADGGQYTNFSQFGDQTSGGGWFGGQGGSGRPSGGNGYVGGKGGGAQGGGDQSNNAGNGVHGTGGGSGGSRGPFATGSGGHGIALIRHADNAFTSITEGANMSLQSIAFTASAQATTADLILNIENAAGTATINTDIKGYVSRDNGSNWTQGTFVDEGEWGTNSRILAFHNLDISGQPSGTSMKYKITTHNQSGSKKTRIHATSLAWA